MLRKIIKQVLGANKLPSHLSTEKLHLAKAYQLERPGIGHRTFCHAAEINMLFSQEGEVFVCCHNQSYPIGKYPDQSIAEIWNSSAAKTLREKLRNYDLGDGCKVCEDDFKRGAFHEVRARHFDTLKPHPEYPVMMEFLLSNVCNLECIMCNGKFSSLIRKNREQLPPLKFPYDEAFLSQLDEFIPYLKETRFSGSGEAFSIDMNYVIWEKIISKNPSCIIMVQTNGTILSARVKEILEKGNFQIGISIDSLQKEVYEKIRINANFEKVMENLKYFKDYSKRKRTRFSLSMCMMRQNWKEVPDFIRFCNENEAVATIHKVWFPKFNAIHNLPKNELLEIYNFFMSIQLNATNKIERTNQSHFKYIVSIIEEWYLAEKEEPINIKEYSLPVINSEDFDNLNIELKNHINKAAFDQKTAHNDIEICAKKLLTFFNLLSEEEQKIAMAMLKKTPIAQIYEAFLFQKPDVLKESFNQLK